MEGVKPGNVPAGAPCYVEATTSGAAPNLTWTYQPKACETDQFYQSQSNWIFYVEDEDQAYPIHQWTSWWLHAVAVRDPSYRFE